MGLAVEQIEAALGGLADGAFVAFDPAVERRLARDDRALEGRERKLDFCREKSYRHRKRRGRRARSRGFQTAA